MRQQHDKPMPLLRAVVWYADGSKLNAATIAAWRALPDGVVIVQVLYDYVRKGKYLQDVLAGNDWYWWHGSVIRNTRAGDIPKACDQRAIKAGAAVTREEFVRAYNSACDGVVVE